MATRTKYRLDDERPQLFVKITILGSSVFLPKRFESLRLSAMEKAKAQLILGASSKEAAIVAADDLLMSLHGLRIMGIEDDWLIEAMKNLIALQRT